MTREEIVAVLCGLRILQRGVVNHGEPLAQFMVIFTDGETSRH
jgi:hypothetical protein